MRIEASANPSVLIWARRMAGLEVSEAARRAHVKPERVECWERGERRPSLTQLRNLANIYKRPLAVFFLETPPPDEAPPNDYRRFDPQATEPLSPEIRVAIRDARSRRGAAIELIEELGESLPDFSLRADLRDDPEEVGAHLRGALGFGPEPNGGDPRAVFNLWRTAAEDAGVLVFQTEMVDLDEMRGFSITEHPLPAVVLNTKDAYQGRSFSLVHELGHILLHRGGLCVLNESGPPTVVQRTEAFCNHVAGAALVPAESLLRQPEVPSRLQAEIPDNAVRSLANRYGASPEAVIRRLSIVGRVSQDFYRQKRQQFQKQYAELRRRPSQGRPPRARLAVAKGGHLFAQLVLEAYDEGRITGSDVAELFGERLKHLPRIRAEARSTPRRSRETA